MCRDLILAVGLIRHAGSLLLSLLLLSLQLLQSQGPRLLLCTRTKGRLAVVTLRRARKLSISHLRRLTGPETGDRHRRSGAADLDRILSRSSLLRLLRGHILIDPLLLLLLRGA